MVATLVVTLNQVPPLGVPLSEVLSPTHASADPEIEGRAFIVTAEVTAVTVGQPAILAVNVYTPALPAATPFTLALIVDGLVMPVPPGPVHAKFVAPGATPLSESTCPRQTGFGVADAE